MLISPAVLAKKFGANPLTILHIGAHRGEERTDYLNSNWGSHKITWVESQQSLVLELTHLLKDSSDEIVQATAWDISGVELDFHVSNNSQSSSVFELGTHSDNHPEVRYEQTYKVLTLRLDELFPKDSQFDLINLDIQGAELKALIGLGDIIARTKWIYSEVNKEAVYKSGALISDLDSYLRTFHFKRVATIWNPRVGWGDAFWIHRSLLPFWPKRVMSNIYFLTQKIITIARYHKSRIAH
jgi:FkbM family methyltransferase